MTYSIAQFLLLGLLTLIFVGAITPVMRKFAIRIDAVDAPNLSRKLQKAPVPYLGGVAIALGILCASYGALLYADFSMETLKLASFVLIPATAIAIMGLVDDLKGLQPWPRLIAQTVTRWAISGELTPIRTLGGHRRYRQSEVLEKLRNYKKWQRKEE